MRWSLVFVALWVWVCPALGKPLKAGASPPPASAVSETPVPDVWNQGPLGQQAAALSAGYRSLGKVHRLRPRLLGQEEEFPVVLPPSLTAPDTDSCSTLTVLAAPNISFLLVFPPGEDEARRRAWPVPSAAGAAEVTRCGARKALLDGIFIKLRSRRGVVELIAVESENPPPPVSELLPARNPGPSLPSPQVGRRPWLAPLRVRLAEATAKNQKEGADGVRQSALPADAGGQGSSVVHLDVGCHRLELLPESSPDSPPDLDGRLYTLTRGEEVVADEEHRAHVVLEHCVGRPERFRLDFTGAPPQSEVVLVHSSWSIPEGLPTSWGPLARARLAQAAWNGGLHQPVSYPVYSSLGVRGTTQLSIPIDPAACYTALLAPIRGDVTSLALGARSQNTTSEAHASGSAGTSVAFCAHGRTRALVEAQALGTGVAWILGVWKTGSLAF